MATPLNVKSFIAKHRREAGNVGICQVQYEREELDALLMRAREAFTAQPMLLDIGAPVTLVGDIHGQFPDLLRIFTMGGWPPQTCYLFLGDYVDRGPMGLECICLLLAFKVHYAQRFFLLRGNHECHSINKLYGFLDECQRRFDTSLWQVFQTVFRQMPLSARVARRILCMHGGLSEELTHLNQINKIQRPLSIPEGLAQDLLWADPDFSIEGFGVSPRGVSKVFGADVVEKFCNEHDLDMIVRAHQVFQDGYQFFAGKRLLTIFSAPNYCGEFTNHGAILVVDRDLKTKLRSLAPLAT